MTYYLLDHPNPKAPERSNGLRGWYYPTRTSEVRGIVMHTPETLEDYTGPDGAAEAVASYLSTVGRPASVHACTDSDSTVDCLPDDHTAFHAAGVNSQTVGVEAGYKATSWPTMPSGRRAGNITQLADWCVGRVLAYGLDLRVIATKADWEAGARGFLEHRLTENWYGTPGRRSDPGVAFPWSELFTEIERLVAAMSRFADVPKSHLFYNDIETMAEAGVARGVKADDPNTTANEAMYAPDAPVTRGQMAAFLARFAAALRAGKL